MRVAERLHEFGLLPEDKRKKFVQTVGDYAVEGEDTHALNDSGIRAIFTDEEYDGLVERVRSELVPNLNGLRRKWQKNQPHDERPEEHLQPLLNSFETLQSVFADDDIAMDYIRRESEGAQQWIAENTEEEPDRGPRVLSVAETEPQPQSARSIFDDIDDGDEGATDAGS